MKSKKRVKPFSEILLPYQVTFPYTVEGSVNNKPYKFPRNTVVTLSYAEYEAILHSDYGKYLR